MTRAVALLVMLSGLSGLSGAGAEAEAPLALELEAAKRRAIETSARLAELEALSDGAEAAEERARLERLPQANLSLRYTRNSHVPEFFGPDGEVIFPDIPNQYRSRIALELPFYTGGRLPSQIEAARREALAAGADREVARADLVMETVAAYWNLVSLRESVTVLARAVESLEAHRRDAENRRRVGLAATNEVLAVQVEKQRAELSRRRAESDVELAQANVLRLIDLPPDRELQLTEPLMPPDLPVEEREALLDRALAARPERRSLRERLAAASARVALARSGRLPSLSFAGGYDYSNPNLKIVPPTEAWRGTWDLGVSFSWNFFDAGRSQAEEGRARAQVEALERRLADFDQRLALEVKSRQLNLATEIEAIQLAELALEAATENQRVSAERYRAGLIPSSELLDAELALLRAGLERTDALAAALVAKTRLDRAVGN